MTVRVTGWQFVLQGCNEALQSTSTARSSTWAGLACHALVREDLPMVRALVVPPEDAAVLVGVSQERCAHVQQRAHAETWLL